MLNSDTATREALLKGIEKQVAARGPRDRGVNITPAKFVPSVDLAQRIKDEANVELNPEQIKKILAVTRRPPPRKVPYQDNKMLAGIISKHGIRQIPDLNNITTAQAWLAAKMNKAIKDNDQKAFDKWAKCSVDYQDFDDDPRTIDNVVVHNRDDPGDVFAIDGYKFGPRDSNLVQRGYYGTYTTKHDRKENKLTLEYRKYLRRYQTEKARNDHPFDEKFMA
jgi:hypothetical protein